MTEFKYENLLASIFMILCSSGIGFGQDEPPQPPKKATSSRVLMIVEVQQELQLSPDQIEKIRKIDREMLTELNQIRIRSMEGKSPEDITNKNLPDDVRSKIAEIYKSKIADAERAITEDILLDFQAKRLNQIQWRIEMNRIGIERFLKDDSVSSFLGMTEKEKKDFSKKVLAEKGRMAKEIQKLRIEMERNVFSFIPKTCQENFDELLGDEFQVKRSSWQRQENR